MTWKRLLRWAITLVLLAYVVDRSGILDAAKRDDLIATFAGIRPVFLLAALCMNPLLNMASALKWHMLLQAEGGSPGFWRLFAYYMVGQFYNLILPTSLGGDVVRIHELGRVTSRRSEAVASVFVERFTGFVTMIVIAILAVLINLRLLNLPIITVSVGGFALLIMVVAWMVLDARLLEVVRRTLGDGRSTVAAFLDKLEKVQSAVIRYGRSGRAMRWALLNSLLFYLLAIVNVWVSACTFSDAVDIQSAVVATPVILVIMNLPVSIGNIGLLEFAVVFTLELLGFPSALGVSIAVWIRIRSILDALLGAVLHPIVSGGRSIRTEIQDKQASGRGMDSCQGP